VIGDCSLREEHDADIGTGKYELILVFRADDNQAGSQETVVLAHSSDAYCGTIY